jgi:hypothetical protein
VSLLDERKIKIFKALVDAGGNTFNAAKALDMDPHYLKKMIDHDTYFSRFKSPAKVRMPIKVKMEQDVMDMPVKSSPVKTPLTTSRFNYICIDTQSYPNSFICKKCKIIIKAPETLQLDYFIGCAQVFRKLHLECEDIL